jgi:hypothetical protein
MAARVARHTGKGVFSLRTARNNHPSHRVISLPHGVHTQREIKEGLVITRLFGLRHSRPVERLKLVQVLISPPVRYTPVDPARGQHMLAPVINTHVGVKEKRGSDAGKLLKTPGEDRQDPCAQIHSVHSNLGSHGELGKRSLGPDRITHGRD